MDDAIANSYAPFLSHGSVSFVGQLEKIPVKILRDTRATQTLILDSVFPFSSESFTGNSVLLQGLELGTVQVPLHKLELSSDIVPGSVVVGLRPSLPVKGISLILGNDVAGGKVEANPCVSDAPSHDVSGPVEAVPGLFPACAVTRAMAQRVMESGNPEVMQNPVLSPERLVEEQTNDPELCKLREQAVSETKACKVPVCYFMQGNILMQKWQPKEVSCADT